MSAPVADTEAALDFLEHMFDAGVMRHLVAIDEDGKIAARSFRPTEREAALAWIEACQGNSNLYYSANETTTGGVRPCLLHRPARPVALRLESTELPRLLRWRSKLAPQQVAGRIEVFSGYLQPF
jgi:hypothetical protein